MWCLLLVLYAVTSQDAPVWLVDDVTDYVLMSGVRCKDIKGCLTLVLDVASYG